MSYKNIVQDFLRKMRNCRHTHTLIGKIFVYTTHRSTMLNLICKANHIYSRDFNVTSYAFISVSLNICTLLLLGRLKKREESIWKEDDEDISNCQIRSYTGPYTRNRSISPHCALWPPCTVSWKTAEPWKTIVTSGKKIPELAIKNLSFRPTKSPVRENGWCF